MGAGESGLPRGGPFGRGVAAFFDCGVILFVFFLLLGEDGTAPSIVDGQDIEQPGHDRVERTEIEPGVQPLVDGVERVRRLAVKQVVRLGLVVCRQQRRRHEVVRQRFAAVAHAVGLHQGRQRHEPCPDLTEVVEPLVGRPPRGVDGTTPPQFAAAAEVHAVEERAEDADEEEHGLRRSPLVEVAQAGHEPSQKRRQGGVAELNCPRIVERGR